MADTEWFAKCGWGVFCHYLGNVPSGADGAQLSSDDWNRQVDSFDVKAFAEQMVRVRAPYVFITLGQNSGHYIAPNAAYDRLTGIVPSKCSRRDLVSDLYDALQPKGIELLVYGTSGAPTLDKKAAEALEWKWGFEEPWPDGWPNAKRNGARLASFQRKWEEINREWSLRWGRKIRGWWIDGCYFVDEMYRHADEPNFGSFAAALRTGNPDAILAFCSAWVIPVPSITEHEDYTAGELFRALPECYGPWVEYKKHKARFHTLNYLGSTWCAGDKPRFPDDLVASYAKYVAGKGGVTTWDVPIGKTGAIPDVFLSQLKAIGTAVRE